jgi:hypothetical protein
MNLKQWFLIKSGYYIVPCLSTALNKAQENLNLWHLLDHYSYFSRMSEPGKDVNISALLNSFQMGYDKRVRPNYGGKTKLSNLIQLVTLFQTRTCGHIG